jgi:hypothetical protein
MRSLREKDRTVQDVVKSSKDSRMARGVWRCGEHKTNLPKALKAWIMFAKIRSKKSAEIGSSLSAQS